MIGISITGQQVGQADLIPGNVNVDGFCLLQKA